MRVRTAWSASRSARLPLTASSCSFSMAAAPEPPASPAVMQRMRPTRRTLLLVAGIAVIAASLCVPVLQRLREPVYQGRRVSAWFDDLCSGVFAGHDASRVSSAAVAFGRMDSNAVPFLLGQFSSDRSGRIERLELAARKVPIFAQFAHRLVLPSSRRTYAAVALQHLGTNAVCALTPLLANYGRDRSPPVGMNILVAMAHIVGVPTRESWTPAQWQEFERTVLERVRKVREGR